MFWMSGKKVAFGILAVLLIAGIGGAAGVVTYKALDDNPVSKPTEPAPSQPQPVPNQPKPEPTTPQEPAKTPDTPTKPQEPAKTPPAVPSDVISVRAFQGSGSMPLTDKGLKNSAFDIERIDWSEANNSLVVVGKMRVFEAVAYMRVRDENKAIVEPERVIRAAAGAPAWSPMEGTAIARVPEHKGKTLLVDFYEKSANDGSRIHMLTFKIRPE